MKYLLIGAIVFSVGIQVFLQAMVGYTAGVESYKEYSHYSPSFLFTAVYDYEFKKGYEKMKTHSEEP